MYVIFFLKSIKSWRIAALNRFFESNQREEILKIIEEDFKLNDNEISNIVDAYQKYKNTKRDENN